MKSTKEAAQTFCHLTFSGDCGGQPCRNWKCMAWRWDKDKYQCLDCKAIHRHIFEAVACCRKQKALSSQHPITLRKGYCGFAGKPEDLL